MRSCRAASRRHRRRRDETGTTSTSPSRTIRGGRATAESVIGGGQPSRRGPSRGSARRRIRNRPAGEERPARAASIVRFADPENDATSHSPAWGANSRHALECGVDARAVAVDRRAGSHRNAERTLRALRNQGTRSRRPRPSLPRIPDERATRSSTTLSGTKRAPFQRTFDDAGGRPQTARRHHEQGIPVKRETRTESHGRLGAARGRIQPLIEQIPDAPWRWRRRSTANRCDKCDPRGRGRPNRGRCATARWAEDVRSYHQHVACQNSSRQVFPRNAPSWLAPASRPDRRRRPAQLRLRRSE